jgi:hypothetical protein
MGAEAGGQAKLYLAIDKIANLFHAPAVDAEITVADS